MLRFKQYLNENRSSARQAYEKAKDFFKVTGGIDRSLEKEIKTSAEYAYFYVKDVIGGPWREAEDVIMKNPQYAYKYAKEVLFRRWPECEPYIKDSMPWAYLYAVDVAHDRFPEAEKTIKSRPVMWKDYLAKRYDWTYYTRTRPVDDLNILSELVRLFPHVPKWGMTTELQRELVEVRPDLINMIKYLDPDLEKEYPHEMSSARIDI